MKSTLRMVNETFRAPSMSSCKRRFGITRRELWRSIMGPCTTVTDRASAWSLLGGTAKPAGFASLTERRLRRRAEGKTADHRELFERVQRQHTRGGAMPPLRHACHGPWPALGLTWPCRHEKSPASAAGLNAASYRASSRQAFRSEGREPSQSDQAAMAFTRAAKRETFREALFL